MGSFNGLPDTRRKRAGDLVRAHFDAVAVVPDHELRRRNEIVAEARLAFENVSECRMAAGYRMDKRSAASRSDTSKYVGSAAIPPIGPVTPSTVPAITRMVAPPSR